MTISGDLALRAGRGRLIRHGTIDLGVARRIMKAHPMTILAAIAVCAVLSVLYLHLAPRRYTVQLYVTAAVPAQKSNNPLSALTSLAGVDLGAAENPRFREFLSAVRSPVAAEAIVHNQDMLRTIFPREWSFREGRWREPHSSMRAPANFLKRMLGIPVVPWTPPDAARVYEYLRDNLKVIPDAKSGIVTLELDSARPREAERLLVALNQAIDEWMRQHDLQHANADIAYLSQQLAKTTVEELRSALAANLTEQEHARMLASSPLPYVSDMLGTPIVSSRPAYPRAIPLLIAAIVIGFLIGLAIATRKYGRR
jgi:uncharacterized protein involved in exopolysaccharide biosynthesis